ncbi:hypothetical protein [Streptomyces sp. GS7]|nr:hypothetical protein [Streptomyces sp. GS7]
MGFPGLSGCRGFLGLLGLLGRMKLHGLVLAAVTASLVVQALP